MKDEKDPSMEEIPEQKPFRLVRKIRSYTRRKPQEAQRKAYQRRYARIVRLSGEEAEVQRALTNQETRSWVERLKNGAGQLMTSAVREAGNGAAVLVIGGIFSVILVALFGTLAMGGLVFLGGGTAATNDFYAPSMTLLYAGYEVPEEYLKDTRFAGMLREAEKYLGYEYVWGGASPDTGFDCSGFVCWVINHSGNGWNVGRRTAEQLRRYCDIIPLSEARPGDLIFLQGTYETRGASHVGIYVGDDMVLHCGNPIQYAYMDSFWREHFLCVGRIPR